MARIRANSQVLLAQKITYSGHLIFRSIGEDEISAGYSLPVVDPIGFRLLSCLFFHT